MSEDALIRLENLKRLGKSAKELEQSVGGRYTYWRDLLLGNKSFGEKAARKIEAKLGLVRGQLDAAHGNADILAPSPTLSAQASNQAAEPANQSLPAINGVAQNAPMDYLIAQIHDPVVRAEVVRDVANIILAAIRKQQANPLQAAPQTPETQDAERLTPSKHP